MDIVLNKNDKLTLTINNLTNSNISIPDFPSKLEEGSILLWNIVGAIHESTGTSGPTGASGPEPTGASGPTGTTGSIESVRPLLNTCLSKFNDQITVNTNSNTYNYLLTVASEAYSQYYNNASENNLPLFVKQDNFPNLIDYYGNRGDESSAFMTMLGTICSSLLSELYPAKRNQLLKIGYNAGGYTMSSNAYVYGWKFRCDPNIMRIIGASILACMHGKTSNISTKINTMRSEVGGTAYTRDIMTIVSVDDRWWVGDDQFYIDFRNFMNSAPGPYAANKDRSSLNPTFSDTKHSNKSLDFDMTVYDHVVNNYNLDSTNTTYKQRTVQAIADKEMNCKHIFGKDTRGLDGQYDFNAVYGPTTIGMTINLSSDSSNFLYNVMDAGIKCRGILQHNLIQYGPLQYGRARPGGNWEDDNNQKHSSDNKYNVLTKYVIEYNDGEPNDYYNNENVILEPGVDPSTYEETQRNSLPANSYPSGHSSGIMCIALAIMQKYPNKADFILKATNNFAINRVIARYHWLSDTIQGRVIGALMAPIVRATKDYYIMLNNV